MKIEGTYTIFLQMTGKCKLWEHKNRVQLYLFNDALSVNKTIKCGMKQR
jgi:hypothetical protein